MQRRNADIETVPHSLETASSRRSPPRDNKSFAEIVGDFFRRNGQANAQVAVPAHDSPPAAQAPDAAHDQQPATKPDLLKHWNAIQADGISASQFIAFLQPLADLDGITVSYSYSDDDGREHVYNRRHDDEVVPRANPLSEAIRKGKLSKEKALTFALNEEGRVWIESNFLDLK
jgi:hypothetical protein